MDEAARRLSLRRRTADGKYARQKARTLMNRLLLPEVSRHARAVTETVPD
jgi:hypothetical protein